MDDKNTGAVDPVTNNEAVTETNTELAEARARIAELEEVAKSKSIEARLAKKDVSTPSVKSGLLERVTRMELKDNGISENDEVDIILKEAKDLGVEPLVLVKKGLTDGLLAKHRKAKADELATPGTSSRATASTKDSAEYWVAKGELPPADQVELRRKVVKKKRDGAKRATMFNY